MGLVEFARILRERRSSRRLSQLELALRAGTTQRHLSFIESGRSVPGREMVIRLGESLELPLRERNEFLLAAGFAPAYPQTPLDHEALAPVMDALEHILAAHVPYPAIIVDRHGELVAANAAQHILFDGCAAELLVSPANAYRIALHPDGMAPRIANFPDWAPACPGGHPRRPAPQPRRPARVPGRRAQPVRPRRPPQARPPGLRGAPRAPVARR